MALTSSAATRLGWSRAPARRAISTSLVSQLTPPDLEILILISRAAFGS